MPLIQKKSGIIFAMDSEDMNGNLSILEEGIELIDAVKINYPTILQEGLDIISRIQIDYELPVIADLKIADVKITNDKIMKMIVNKGASVVFVHGFIGEKSIRDCVEIGRDRTGVVLITELTSDDTINFFQPYAKEFARLAVTTKCYGIQAPGNRPSRIHLLREIVGPEMAIFACGMGVQGGRFGEATKAGATFEIIGRAIYDSPNPVSSLVKISKLIGIKNEGE